MTRTKFLCNVLALGLIVLVVQACSENHCQNNGTSNVAIENIMSRTSVRKYADRDVEDSTINIMLKAAMAAPTAYNIRPWHFVVVKDRAQLDKIGDHANDSRQAIVVCGDTTMSESWFIDCSLAGENILLAAHALGLGAVWTAGYPDNKRVALIRDVVGLPANIMPLCVIVFGYPQTPQPEAAKNKYNATLIHRNRF